MNSLKQKQNQIHFKVVETPTAWVVFAFAWKIVDGSVIYSEPRLVRVVQKKETALAGKIASRGEICLLAGKYAAAEQSEDAILSPYANLFVFENTFTPTRSPRSPTFAN